MTERDWQSDFDALVQNIRWDGEKYIFGEGTPAAELAAMAFYWIQQAKPNLSNEKKRKETIADLAGFAAFLSSELADKRKEWKALNGCERHRFVNDGIKELWDDIR